MPRFHLVTSGKVLVIVRAVGLYSEAHTHLHLHRSRIGLRDQMGGPQELYAARGSGLHAVTYKTVSA